MATGSINARPQIRRFVSNAICWYRFVLWQTPATYHSIIVFTPQLSIELCRPGVVRKCCLTGMDMLTPGPDLVWAWRAICEFVVWMCWTCGPCVMCELFELPIIRATSL